MATRYYTDCSCPHCRVSLDGVAETDEACPTCNKPLEPSAVWATRKYPGALFLPPWVTAFGWPLLLILAGLGFGWWIYAMSGKISFLPAFPISIGLVFFFVKLSSADR